MSYLKRFILKIAAAYGIAFVCRLAFYIIYSNYFSEQSFRQILDAFLIGVKFDTVALAYTLSLFILLSAIPFSFRTKTWYQKICSVFYALGIFIFTIPNVFDLLFFNISKRRTGAEFVYFIDADFKKLIPEYIVNYWYGFLVIPILFFFLFWFLKKLHHLYPLATESWNTSKKVKAFFIFILTLGITFLAMRGGIEKRPFLSVDAGKYVTPTCIPLALNTPVQLLSSVNSPQILQANYMPENEAEQSVQPIKKYSNKIAQTEKPNVVIIIMESMGREYFGYYHQEKRYTPFLDSLMKQSLVFNTAYANASTSKEGIPAVLGGIPSWLTMPFLESTFQSNNTESIGHYLKKMGYSTSFYHGGQNGTMHFDNYIPAADFGRYFGKNEYIGNSSDDDGTWGIRDEPYLQYWCNQLSKEKQPFCSALFTLSNHDPYSIPAHLKSSFKEGSLPIHKTVQYADYAVEQFFKSAQKQPWYSNTLFIITADHTSLNDDKNYANNQGRFLVPIILFSPSQKLESSTNKIVQQIDILPSVLNYVGYPDSFFALGNSVFDSTKGGYVIQYNGGGHQLITGKTMHVFDGTNWQKETVKFSADSANIDIEKTLKASLQVFSKRLQKNALHY